MSAPKVFTTTVVGVGPWCVEFADGEIVTTRYVDRANLIAAAPDLLALARQYASECAECDGKGYCFEGEALTGRGPDDVFPEQVACPECEDIRAVITRATK